MAEDGELPDIEAANIIAAEQPDVFGSLERRQGNAFLSRRDRLAVSARVDRHRGGDNLRDEITYPVAISLVDKGSGSTGADGMISTGRSSPSFALAKISGSSGITSRASSRFATFTFVTSYSRFPRPTKRRPLSWSYRRRFHFTRNPRQLRRLTMNRRNLLTLLISGLAACLGLRALRLNKSRSATDESELVR